MILEAGDQHIPELVRLGAEFYSEAPHRVLGEYRPQAVENMLCFLINHPMGLCYGTGRGRWAASSPPLFRSAEVGGNPHSSKAARRVDPMNGNECCLPNARQCSASSKRTGCRCRAPAMTGRTVCRFHGGKRRRSGRAVTALDTGTAYTRRRRLLSGVSFESCWSSCERLHLPSAEGDPSGRLGLWFEPGL